MIKAVVFDLDDTLISEKQYIQSGFKIVSKEISKKSNLNSEVIYKVMMDIFNESSKEVFNRVLDTLKIEYSKEYIKNLISIYRNHIPEITFFEDVIPTINLLKKENYKLGIITDGYKETQLKKIEVLKCKDLFDEIIITDELGREFWKPHEKPYKLMAERLNINFNEMIYVGDNIKKDFVTANKLGIITIKINRDNGVYSEVYREKEFLAKVNIVSLNEVLNEISVFSLV